MIETVAAHLTDMRLIKNIRNEWEVFRRQIMSESGLQGLDSDKLFAMVVYKNLHPSDFEKIRSGTSLLDVAFRSATEVIRQNSAQMSETARDLATRAKSLSAEEQASELGEVLRTLLDQMSSRFSRQSPAEYEVAGTRYTPTEIGSLKFWKALASKGAKVSAFYLVRDYNQYTAAAEFTNDEIAALLQRSIDPAEWEQKSRDKLESEIRHLRDERENLEEMTLADVLMSDTDYTVTLSDEDREIAAATRRLDDGPVGFKTLIDGLFNDPAVATLLRAEFIDLNFTLYSSEFKDARISASAMTYFMRFVQRGESNLVYEFEKVEDVKSLMDYAGVPAIEGRTFYNVEIVDYLVTAGLSDADDGYREHLFGTLAAGTPIDRGFLTDFADRSPNSTSLVRELARYDRYLFTWLVGTYRDDSRLPDLVSAALSGAVNRIYATDDEVQAFIREAFTRIETLKRPISAEDARRLAAVLQRLGVEFIKLDGLGSEQLKAIVEQQLFEVSEANLRIAVPGSGLSLDELRRDDPKLADHVLVNLGDYLDAVSVSDGVIVSIRDPRQFVAVVEWVGDERAAEVVRVAALAAPNCVVSDVGEVDEALWGSLAQASRIDATITNLRSLFGGVNGGLLEMRAIEQLLAHTGSIEVNAVDDAFEAELRNLILRSSGIATEQKVRLLSSLKNIAPLEVADIEPDNSDFVARLVEARLLPDAKETFSHVRGLPVARAALIARSLSFPSYLSDVQLDLSDLESIATDRSIRDEVRSALLMANGTLDYGDKTVVDDLMKFAVANRQTVQSHLLAKAVKLGAVRENVLELVPINIDNRKADGLNALLKAMGGEYEKLATPGLGSVRLPDDDRHRALVKRLQQVGFAGKISAKSSSQALIVNRKRSASPEK